MHVGNCEMRVDECTNGGANKRRSERRVIATSARRQMQPTIGSGVRMASIADLYESSSAYISRVADICNRLE